MILNELVDVGKLIDGEDGIETYTLPGRFKQLPYLQLDPFSHVGEFTSVPTLPLPERSPIVDPACAPGR